MARRKGKLEEAGYHLVPGTGEKNRRYIAPDGSEVSYRKAFAAVRGESFETATAKRGGGGIYREDYRLARQTRDAAKRGDLSRLHLATKTEEAELAGMTLKAMRKGAPTLRTATKRGEDGLPLAKLPDTLYARVTLARIRADIHVERKEGETRVAYEYRLYDARRSREGRKLVGPKSDKSRLLQALGRKKGEAVERFVGES